MTPEQLRQRRRDKDQKAKLAGMPPTERYFASMAIDRLSKLGKKTHQWRMKQIVKRG